MPLRLCITHLSQFISSGALPPGARALMVTKLAAINPAKGKSMLYLNKDVQGTCYALR